ncbi:MAG: hypothetical protein LIO91_08760 [Bacteroidales bacterium]|nr:hypothetical protein [Bacteroidales bacterium]
MLKTLAVLAIITTILVVGCSTGHHANDYWEEDETSVSERSDVFVSEDGRFIVESGEWPNGGTASDFWTKVRFVNANGDTCNVTLDSESYHKDPHAITKDDGTTYYLVRAFSKASSVDGYEWMEAYRIVGDTISEVNPVDGVSAPDSCGTFWVNYDIAECYYASYGKGYDWMYRYDPRTKTLYVPLVDDALRTTDRYQVYRHNGDRFVDLGERPHWGLDSTVSHYVRLIRYFNVAGHIGRIDSLADGQWRMAIWKYPKSMSNTPDFVI